MQKLLFVFALILGLNLSGQNIQLKRGPYLNMATQDGITLRFRTDKSCTGSVTVYDQQLNELANYAESSPSDSDHVISVSGLDVQSTYRYECFCDDELLTDISDERYHFKTQVADDYEGPINIWAIGDFGTGNEDQRAVRNAYLEYMATNDWETDVWLMLGDNAYGDGTDHEFQINNFDIYSDEYKYMTAWPAPGNHDYKSIDIITHDGPYYEIYTMPTNGEAGGLASGNEYYYSFDYGNVHFICLNSEWSPWIYAPVVSPMVIWMLADMQQSDKTWKIAYWHQPPYTKGSHDSDDPFGIMNMFRQNILPFLELGGCDLALQGHSHCYERSTLISGHYGYSQSYNRDLHEVQGGSGNLAAGEAYYKATEGLNAGKGTVYNVVGNSGKVSDSGTMDHPVMYYNDNVNKGSTAIRVHGDTLTGRYISHEGELLDEYTIIKTPDGRPSNSTHIKEFESMPSATQLRLRQQDGAFWLNFDVASPSSAQLKLFDVHGKEVATLLPKTQLNKGPRMYKIPQELPAGNYLGVLTLNNQRFTSAFNLK